MRAVQLSTSQRVAIKVTNKILHLNKMSSSKGNFLKVDEDVIKEASILQHLTNGKNCPASIVKFVDLFQRYLRINHIKQN